MPIYAYKCESCGQSKDVLQKMSDAPLSVCPFCGADAFKKQVTAAGFQLKGSGWYVTDFKNGNTAAPAPAAAAADGAKPASSDASAKSADTSASPASPAATPAPAAKSETAAAPAKAAAPRSAD